VKLSEFYPLTYLQPVMSQEIIVIIVNHFSIHLCRFDYLLVIFFFRWL